MSQLYADFGERVDGRERFRLNLSRVKHLLRGVARGHHPLILPKPEGSGPLNLFDF